MQSPRIRRDSSISPQIIYDEEVLAPCEIFAVTERIPQMLELIQDCHVLQTENPLKYEGIKSERLEKGSKLFYKYKVKQSKNYMHQDESRVYYEIASGQWVSSTSVKGKPVLRRMPSSASRQPLPVDFTAEEKFQTKPISADPPFTPQSKAHMKARVRYRNILNSYARHSDDTANNEESGMWPLKMLWTKAASDEGAVCPLIDALVDNRYRIVDHIGTTSTWHGWRAVDTLNDGAEVFLKTFRSAHDVDGEFKNAEEMNLAAQKEINKLRVLVRMQIKTPGPHNHKNISSVLQVTHKYAPKTIALRKQQTNNAKAQTEILTSKIHFSVEEFCDICRIMPQREKPFLLDMPYLDVVSSIFKQLIEGVQWQHSYGRHQLNLSPVFWFARSHGGYVLKLPLSGVKWEDRADFTGIAQDLRECGKVLKAMTFDTMPAQIGKQMLHLYRQQKLFTKNTRSKLYLMIARNANLKEKVESLLEMLQMLNNPPAEADAQDVLSKRFLRNIHKVKNLQAKVTHFVELMLNPNKVSDHCTLKDIFPAGDNSTATADYCTLEGKTVVDVKEILVMLVEDYRKQFTAKGFATEDIQFFSRFYPKKGVGHASIVIPSVDYSDSEDNAEAGPANPMSPPVKPKPSRSFSKASISSFASASSEMFEAEMDSPSRALSSTALDSSKYVHTAIHMIVQEIRNEPCHVCANVVLGGVSKQSIWLDFKTRWNEVKDKTTAKEQKRGAVRSVVEVIKACREAFENPENLDEYLMMDKIADLLARVENTKHRKNIGELKNKDPIHKFLAHSLTGFANNFFVHSTPWAWSIDPTQISTSGEYAKKYTTHETSYELICLIVYCLRATHLLTAYYRTIPNNLRELGKSVAIMLTRNLRVKMAKSKMEQQHMGGKLIDTPTFVSRTKHKAQLYSEMQKILAEQNEKGENAHANQKPKARKKLRVTANILSKIKSRLSRIRRIQSKEKSLISKPSALPRFNSSPASLTSPREHSESAPALMPSHDTLFPSMSLDSSDDEDGKAHTSSALDLE